MFSRPYRGATLAAVFLTGSFLAVIPAAAVSGGTVTNYGFAAKISMDGRACSGALVEPTLVLTSASCFPENPQGGVPAKATTVIVGRPDLTTTTGNVAKVTQLYVRTDRDVALARIDTAVTTTTPLPLADAAGVPGSAETVNLIGWGRTGDEWVLDKVHRAQFTTTASTATTLSLTGADGADACKGDAGAPIMRTDSAGKLSIAAVSSTSWQHGCLTVSETRQGTTAARVDDLNVWVRSQAIVGTAKAAGRDVSLSWTPMAAAEDVTYTVYASSNGDPTPAAAMAIGTTKATTLLHSATSRKTWRYLVVASNGAVSPVFQVTTGARALTDFTGDGKADIGRFTRGTTGDAFVANSDGTKFAADPVKWHDHFSINSEVALSGDFNGDGKADVVTFNRGTAGDVFVALSDGTKFTGDGVLWHDYFGVNDETPAVGDFNGDGRDDIAIFKRGTSGDVLVALSDGTKFGTGALWHDYFGINDETPAIGDFNGDGRDDIAIFKRGTSGDVLVALSDGTKFGTGALWHDYFGINDEIPGVGDFNGDGRDDLVTFVRNTGQAYVTLSDGTKFGTSSLWVGTFGTSTDLPVPRVITVM